VSINFNLFHQNTQAFWSDIAHGNDSDIGKGKKLFYEFSRLPAYCSLSQVDMVTGQRFPESIVTLAALYDQS